MKKQLPKLPMKDEHTLSPGDDLTTLLLKGVAEWKRNGRLPDGRRWIPQVAPSRNKGRRCRRG